MHNTSSVILDILFPPSAIPDGGDVHQQKAPSAHLIAHEKIIRSTLRQQHTVNPLVRAALSNYAIVLRRNCYIFESFEIYRLTFQMHSKKSFLVNEKLFLQRCRPFLDEPTQSAQKRIKLSSSVSATYRFKRQNRSENIFASNRSALFLSTRPLTSAIHRMT